jgi:hypothetical protein
MTDNAQALDHWIRTDFRQINTALEEIYFSHPDKLPGKLSDSASCDVLKQQLVAEGTALVSTLLREGNTDEGFDRGFDLLGNVGFYMAACRRHDITDPAR